MFFDQVEKIAPNEEAMAQIRNAMTVLSAMVDAHATLEEELLFAALEPHLGKYEGPLAQMRAEHDELERLLGQIEKAEDVNQATAWVEETLRTARSHFHKEERVLFPMAERLLGEEALTRLGKAWADARGVAIG